MCGRVVFNYNLNNHTWLVLVVVNGIAIYMYAGPNVTIMTLYIIVKVYDTHPVPYACGSV